MAVRDTKKKIEWKIQHNCKTFLNQSPSTVSASFGLLGYSLKNILQGKFILLIIKHLINLIKAYLQFCSYLIRKLLTHSLSINHSSSILFILILIILFLHRLHHHHLIIIKWFPEQKHLWLRREYEVVLPPLRLLDSQFPPLFLAKESLLGHQLESCLCQKHMPVLIAIIIVLLAVLNLLAKSETHLKRD